MKSGNTSDIIYKEVVVIGNGPSGIALSFMLSGNIPYIISDSHPDEMLSARLRPVVGQCLLQQDLSSLSAGLEGRSTNQVSLLVDALLHPCADIGLELPPLVEFRKAGNQIDHIVLGKGPPGGSWHRMDPQILTLSLGSWMSLPGLPFHSRDSGENRAFASNVAAYYVQYNEQMELSRYFRNNVLVTSVEPLNQNKRDSLEMFERSRMRKNTWARKHTGDFKSSGEVCIRLETDEKCEKNRTCFISDAIDCLMLKNRKKSRCKRPREQIADNSPTRKISNTEQDFYQIVRSTNDKKRSTSFCCDSDKVCDKFYSRSFNDNVSVYSLRNTCSLDFNSVPLSYNFKYCDADSHWIVSSVDVKTGEKITYSCKYLVLANGGSDIPNRLEVSKNREDPDWLVYDLRSLESKLDVYMEGKRAADVEPVLVVGAGLSAADAIIAARGRNVPVIHVFRNKSPDLNKQLPENLYPEYHKVHQMMIDGGFTYPLYTAYPEYSLADLDEKSRIVILKSIDGEEVKIQISFAVVLIGSRPDLSFLPQDFQLGFHKHLPVDCKTNTVDIDSLTHRVNNYKNLFVVGPLAGDNFVRFLPGGALAVVAELYKENRHS